MNKLQSAGVSLLMIVLLSFIAVPARADEAAEAHERTTSLFPLIKYDYAAFDSQGLHSPALGLMIMSDDEMLLGFYTRHRFSEPLRFGFPRVYHSVDLLYEKGADNHRFLYLFKSAADKPVISGYDSFQTAAVYGYRLVNTPHTTLVLGGGLAVSDFGIELDDGRPWPLIPVPLIRLNHDSTLLKASFDFITGPNLSLTFLPEQHFRIGGDFRMDQFRDIQDLVFELTMKYRFFSNKHPLGDFAGVAAGIKNEAFSFTADGKDAPAELNYYSLFGALDLTLVKLSGGYIFQSRDRYKENETDSLGKGFFLGIEGMYQF